jgi:hypothetical protein
MQTNEKNQRKDNLHIISIMSLKDLLQYKDVIPEINKHTPEYNTRNPREVRKIISASCISEDKIDLFSGGLGIEFDPNKISIVSMSVRDQATDNRNIIQKSSNYTTKIKNVVDYIISKNPNLVRNIFKAEVLKALSENNGLQPLDKLGNLLINKNLTYDANDITELFNNSTKDKKYSSSKPFNGDDIVRQKSIVRNEINNLIATNKISPALKTLEQSYMSIQRNKWIAENCIRPLENLSIEYNSPVTSDDKKRDIKIQMKNMLEQAYFGAALEASNGYSRISRSYSFSDKDYYDKISQNPSGVYNEITFYPTNGNVVDSIKNIFIGLKEGSSLSSMLDKNFKLLCDISALQDNGFDIGKLKVYQHTKHNLRTINDNEKNEIMKMLNNYNTKIDDYKKSNGINNLNLQNIIDVVGERVSNTDHTVNKTSPASELSFTEKVEKAPKSGGILRSY